jgi:tetratricopeptide (TPR) repeat protein
VYGLGAVLYEILTGQPPFMGTSSDDVLRQVRESEPASPRRLTAWLPQALDAVCLKAMAKEPGSRYPTATLLAGDMRHFLADESVTAHRERLPARAGRWARQHRSLVAGALTGFVLLVLLAGAGAVFSVRQADRRQAEREQHRAEVDQRVAVGLSAGQAGDVDRATAVLSEAAGLCEQAPELGEKRLGIVAHLHEFERYRDFRSRATIALRAGVHNVRMSEKGEPLVDAGRSALTASRSSAGDVLTRQCEQALGVYGIADRADWDQGLDAVLSPAQLAEVRRWARELLTLTAIRVALHAGRDNAGMDATRRGLALLDRAATLTEPTPGILMLRMLWHRRLKEDADADAAGERMTALVKEGGAMTSIDYYLFGYVALHLRNDPKGALGPFQQVLKREPNHYGALFGSYLCYAGLKDVPNQFPALTGCLVLRPEEADLYYFRGMANFELQRFDEAFNDFDAALSRHPKYRTAYFYRGRMLVVKDKWAEAEKDFAKALELDPTFVQGRSWWAVALAKAGRHAEAVEAAERIVMAEPTERLTVFFAARAYAQAVAAVSPQEPEREALIRKYGERCVALVQQAIKNGFTDTSRLGAGGDFDPVRARTDFQELLKSAPKPKKGKDD